MNFSYNFLQRPLHPFAIFLLLYINLDVELFYLSLILVLFICVNEILLELYTGGRVGPHLIKSSSVMSSCWAWATEKEVRARQQQNRCNNIPAAQYHVLIHNEGAKSGFGSAAISLLSAVKLQ